MSNCNRLVLVSQTQVASQRRGGIIPLMAILLPTLIILGAMAINIAYIQLTRTELMVATDSAARAGGRGMSFYQDAQLALESAQTTAALNTVAGRALLLDIEPTSNVVEFGVSAKGAASNRFQFTKVPTAEVLSGAVPANSVRVNGSATSVPTLFPNMRTNVFDVHMPAVAMQVDRDIALVLDNSGSMGLVTYEWPDGFDPWTSPEAIASGVDAGIIEIVTFSFFGTTLTMPFYVDDNNETTYYSHLWEDLLGLGDAPVSPWTQVNDAVTSFFGVLSGSDQVELVSLTTYDSNGVVHSQLTSDYSALSSMLVDLVSPDGSTGIGNGLSIANPTILSDLARPLAAKTMVVMTDGMHNYGTDPEVIAQLIVDANDVTIHTVTFGDGADITRMKAVADIGGGVHFHAEDADELIVVFEEIANSLPTIVTQ